MQPAANLLSGQPADTAEATSRAGLEQAFALFNQMSSQLSESYSLLEERVSELKGQLALVSAQRMEELAEKERLHELEHQVRDMLVFARGELPLSDRVTPKALFDSLRAAADAHVQGLQVRWQCEARAGELLCSRDTLVGSVLNLVENAIQAGGADLRLKVHLYVRGDSLRLSVSDNGPGMDATTLARLGEPFFTTRATGTGLGLAVVKAVARAHQGQLQLRSRPGRGTCATLILPLIPAAPLSVIQE